LTCGCGKKQTTIFQTMSDPKIAAQLKSFVAAKEAQEKMLADAEDKESAGLYTKDGFELKSPDCRPFFAAAAKGDWPAVSNLWSKLEKGAYNPIAANAERRGGWLSRDIRAIEAFFHLAKPKIYVHGEWQQPVMETFGAIEAFAAGNEKYSAAFGNDIIKSIPAGSIYFGGTDPGRFVVTALMKSHADGKPFFALSQNPLPDGTYLHYLRALYGGKIHTLTDADSQKCFENYMADAQRRLSHDQELSNDPRQIKPGEEVKLDSNGQIQLSGQMNVIGIRELLTKTIFDKNPDREFYVEESFPLDWMYPYLEPHGLIMKINRRQLPELSDEIVQRDSDYWTKYVTPMIGGWLKLDTTVEEVAAFAEKIHVKKNLSGFAGDPQFVQNEYWCKNYSKLRSSIGGLYLWRAQHATDADEKKRMNDAADFAFRQAWALCPYSPETVFRYVNLLTSQNRRADALLVAETAAKMPEMRSFDWAVRDLVTELKQSQKAK
jgi:hypothetical protein